MWNPHGRWSYLHEVISRGIVRLFSVDHHGNHHGMISNYRMVQVFENIGTSVFKCWHNYLYDPEYIPQDTVLTNVEQNKFYKSSSLKICLLLDGLQWTLVQI